MKILIGIKIVSESGSSNSSEGFGGFSITASNVVILASGTESHIKSLVKEAKKQKAMLAKEISELEANIESYDVEADFDKEYNKICKKYAKAAMLIPNYDKLLMVDGELL